MKYILVLAVAFLLTSCDKLKKVADGAEKLQEGMQNTSEGIRKQKLGEASKIMLDENNRKALAPIPSNMMSAARTMAEAIRSDEMLLWSKNYLIKVNEENFTDSYPWIDEGTEEGEISKIKFMLNKVADLQMVILVAGFLPDATLQEMINTQSEQGAYRDVLFAILKLRANFLSDLMLEAGLIGGDKKLETIGQIEKAIEYTEKLDFICNLEFADQIALKVTGFSEKQNEILSKPLDKELALNRWKKVQEKATNGFKAQSFSKDPTKNEAATKDYVEQYKALLKKIQMKIDAYAK